MIAEIDEDWRRAGFLPPRGGRRQGGEIRREVANSFLQTLGRERLPFEAGVLDVVANLGDPAGDGAFGTVPVPFGLPPRLLIDAGVALVASLEGGHWRGVAGDPALAQDGCRLGPAPHP